MGPFFNGLFPQREKLSWLRLSAILHALKHPVPANGKQQLH